MSQGQNSFGGGYREYIGSLLLSGYEALLNES